METRKSIRPGIQKMKNAAAPLSHVRFYFLRPTNDSLINKKNKNPILIIDLIKN